MNASEFYDEMSRFIAERLLESTGEALPGPVAPTENLLDRGLLDSLMVIQMIAHAEEISGGAVDLADTDLVSLYSLEGLYAAVR